ncbi:MAG: hypothetical protein V4598_15675 [Bdellovibrionota bacterium]
MKFLFVFFLFLAPSLSAAELEETLKLALPVIASPSPNFVVCDEAPIPNSLFEVNSVRTEAQRGCDPLQPGKHRQMSRNRYQSGNYVMRNLGNGRYAAVLNLDFVPGPGASQDLVDSMKARTMNCIRSLNPYLRNGNESLEIQIVSSEDRLENFPRPARNEIVVTNQPHDYRGDAGHYGSNFTCRTIGHELLHLLGLCDEYHEGIKEAPAATSRRNPERNFLDWSCRPVTTGVSYMRNIWAFNEILPQVRRCDCNEECQRLMNAPEEIKSMFLSMSGDELMNSEMSLLDDPIVNVTAARTPETRRPFCESVTTSLGPNVMPPVMKSFLYEGNSAGVHTFSTYRPRHTGGENGFYWFGRQQYTCNCNGDTTNTCERLVRALAVRARETRPTVNCPMDVSTPRDIQSSVLPPSTTVRPSELDTTTSPPQLVLRTPGNGQSLLRPQHFERIKAGDCRGGAARNYEYCEQFAYMGRNPISGNGFNMTTIPPNPEVNQCANVPTQCFDDNFYLNGVGSPPADSRRTRRE